MNIKTLKKISALIYLFVLYYWSITKVYFYTANTGLLIKKVDFVVTLDRLADYGCNIIC
jgi:hypothetical protein